MKEVTVDERIVFHVDMDAFYAAVEVRGRPGLAGVPVVIGADPQDGAGRGVASTANYIARTYGIHSAMPISKAYQLCPHAVFLRPDFKKYKPASEEVMAVLERYADVLEVVGLDEGRQRRVRPPATGFQGGAEPHARRALEVVGLDEAYLQITHRAGGDWRKAHSLARSLQAAVKRETSLSCSIGVGPNKAVAKIASDHRKPHGITLVAPNDVTGFLDPLPVRLISGCGPKTAARLEEWGVPTIGDLARSPQAWLQERFGTHGAWLWRIANGDDPRRVHAERGPRKSRGNERTFSRDVQDHARVLAEARRLVQGLMHGSDAFSTMTVKLRYSDFTTLTRSHTLSIPLDRTPQNLDLAAATMEALLDPLLDARAVRLVGARLSGFGSATGQSTLADFRGKRTGASVPS